MTSDADKIKRLQNTLDGIRQYALDTLSGRADGVVDTRWYREGYNEIAKRARLALESAQ